MDEIWMKHGRMVDKISKECQKNVNAYCLESQNKIEIIKEIKGI